MLSRVAVMEPVPPVAEHAQPLPWWSAQHDWEVPPGSLGERRCRRCGRVAPLIDPVEEDDPCLGCAPQDVAEPFHGYAPDAQVDPPSLDWAWHSGGWAWLSYQGWEPLPAGWVGVPSDQRLMLPSSPSRLACYECGSLGHQRRECPSRRDREEARAGGGRCWLCSSPFHVVADCPQRPAQVPGSSCWLCREPGHSARNCPLARELAPSSRCWRCGGLGHVAGTCTSGSPSAHAAGSSSGSMPQSPCGEACWSCGLPGHFARDCPFGQQLQHARKRPRPEG